MEMVEGRTMELEFGYEATLEEVREELLRYRRLGELASTTINGYEILNDSRMDEKLQEAYSSLNLEFIKKHVDSEKLESFEKEMSGENELYGHNDGLMIAACMIKTLENCDNSKTSSTYSKLFDMIESSDDESLGFARNIIRNYIVGGEEIDRVLFADKTNKIVKKIKEKINVIVKRRGN